MSRKGCVKRRPEVADPVFGSVLVAKLITRVMERGEKAIARRIVYGAFTQLKGAEDSDRVKIFEQAVDNVRPRIEVRPRRVGGATYQVPTEVEERRAIALALRWMVNFAQGRSGKSMVEKLSNEIMDAYNNRGGAVNMRETKRKMAEANKAFSHYRW